MVTGGFHPPVTTCISQKVYLLSNKLEKHEGIRDKLEKHEGIRDKLEKHEGIRDVLYKGMDLEGELVLTQQ